MARQAPTAKCFRSLFSARPGNQHSRRVRYPKPEKARLFGAVESRGKYPADFEIERYRLRIDC